MAQSRARSRFLTALLLFAHSVLAVSAFPTLSFAEVAPRSLATVEQVDQTALELRSEIENQPGGARAYGVEILHLEGQHDNPRLRRLIEQLHRQGTPVSLKLVTQKEFEEASSEMEDALLTTYTRSPAPGAPALPYRLTDAWHSVRDSFRSIFGTANGISFFKILRDTDKKTGTKAWRFKHDPAWFKMALWTTLWAETVYTAILHFAVGLPIHSTPFILSASLFPLFVFPILYQKDLVNEFRLQGVTVLIDPNANSHPNSKTLQIRENKILYVAANFAEYLHNSVWLMGLSGGLTSPTVWAALGNAVVNSLACTYASVPAEYATALCQTEAKRIQSQDPEKARSLSKWALGIQYVYWNAVFPIFRNMALLYDQISKKVGLQGNASAWLTLPFPALGLIGTGVEIRRSWGQYGPAWKALIQNIGFWGKGRQCRNLLRIRPLAPPPPSV